VSAIAVDTTNIVGMMKGISHLLELAFKEETEVQSQYTHRRDMCLRMVLPSQKTKQGKRYGGLKSVLFLSVQVGCSDNVAFQQRQKEGSKPHREARKSLE
jgi:hypothetical protein